MHGLGEARSTSLRLGDCELIKVLARNAACIRQGAAGPAGQDLLLKAGTTCTADCAHGRPAAWHGGALCWTRRSRSARTTRRLPRRAPCCRCAHHHHAGMGPTWHGIPDMSVSLPGAVITVGAGLQPRAILCVLSNLPARCAPYHRSMSRRTYVQQHLGFTAHGSFAAHGAGQSCRTSDGPCAGWEGV